MDLLALLGIMVFRSLLNKQVLFDLDNLHGLQVVSDFRLGALHVAQMFHWLYLNAVSSFSEEQPIARFGTQSQ